MINNLSCDRYDNGGPLLIERAAMFFGITTNKKVLELDVFELDFAVLRLRSLFYVPVLLEDIFHGISDSR